MSKLATMKSKRHDIAVKIERLIKEMRKLDKLIFEAENTKVGK